MVNVRVLRVRDHGDLARIEVGRNERELFFDEKHINLVAQKLMDLKGYRSESFDEWKPPLEILG